MHVLTAHEQLITDYAAFAGDDGHPAGCAQQWRVVSFRVPRSQLIPLLADPHGFTAVTHDGTKNGIAQIVASTMTSTWSAIGSLSPSAADAAESAFTAVLAAAAGCRRPEPAFRQADRLAGRSGSSRKRPTPTAH